MYYLNNTFRSRLLYKRPNTHYLKFLPTTTYGLMRIMLLNALVVITKASHTISLNLKLEGGSWLVVRKDKSESQDTRWSK